MLTRWEQGETNGTELGRRSSHGRDPFNSVVPTPPDHSATSQKEKSAAQKALRQYYTSRCLPFYDDLHRKHLEIMQQELGIPGLGRLEPRRRDTTTKAAATPGGAERPIAVDSDDDDDDVALERDENRAEMKTVGMSLAEDGREKALARRRKIMGLIESIMADGLDD